MCRACCPRAKNYQSAGHVIKCRVCWPRAKNDESAGHVIKCQVCWPRAKNYESAGHVIKCRGSFNDNSHSIHASNNAFINHYHLLPYKNKLFFVHNYPEPSILLLIKIFFLIVNQNQAYSCL